LALLRIKVTREKNTGEISTRQPLCVHPEELFRVVEYLEEAGAERFRANDGIVKLQQDSVKGDKEIEASRRQEYS